MSLYAEYLKELENRDTVEHEWGFATFSTNGDFCYLDNIYVKPDHRRSRLATALANEVELIAKSRGCKILIGTIVPSLPGSTDRLVAALSFGLKLQSSRDNFIFLQKDIA
jgi:ribosomal protein S18 acetylase RimI-like enzyme